MGMLEGALILLAGIIIGRLLPARRKTPKMPKPPVPVCGCAHHHAFHDPETGACQATVSVPAKYDKHGDVVAYEKVPCACARYSGPEPLPRFYAPPITEG